MNNVFKIVKALFHSKGPYTDRLDQPPNFTGESPVLMAQSLTRFAPYLHMFGYAFFVQGARGIGRVSAISEEGIRVEWCHGPGNGDYDWLHEATSLVKV